MGKITSIDLFAGVGGMRISLSKASRKLGYVDECKLYSEIDEHCKKTYEKNFPNTKLIKDIKSIKKNEMDSFKDFFRNIGCLHYDLITGFKLTYDANVFKNIFI